MNLHREALRTGLQDAWLQTIQNPLVLKFRWGMNVQHTALRALERDVELQTTQKPSWF